MSNRKTNLLKLFSLLLVAFLLSSCLYTAYIDSDFSAPDTPKSEESKNSFDYYDYDLSDLPEFSGQPFIVINNNQPVFSEKELTAVAYERYSSLDSLGRCGVTVASLGKELMPVEERGDISSIYPSGWEQAKYSFVDGEYLYNRCHLIGWQLTGEDANPKNLVTGTRYLNVQGMLPFENMVADFIKETGSHVAYRVTPVFVGNELVCRGVLMEAYSIEDEGEGICFNVYCYNVQPGVEIDYATGESRLAPQSETSETEQNYVLNTNSKKIHLPTCSSVSSISDKNKKEYFGILSDLLNGGYTKCGACFN